MKPRTIALLSIAVIGLAFLGIYFSNLPQSEIGAKQNFVYVKDINPGPEGAEMIISNFDGSSQKKVFKYEGDEYASRHDISSETGSIVYATREKLVDSNSLWISDNGKNPRKILTSQGPTLNLKISSDGTKIAYISYSDIIGGVKPEKRQLWTINSDGSENKLIIDGFNLSLIPIGWSKDQRGVYMIDQERPIGLYVVDILTKKLDKIKELDIEPGVILPSHSLSPDHTQIAYVATVDFPGGTHSIEVTNLVTGVTTTLVELQPKPPIELPNYNIAWSNDGKKLAYSIRPQTLPEERMYTVDINSKKINLVTTVKNSIRAGTWIGNDRIVYTESYNKDPGDFDTRTELLFTIKREGTDKQEIDSAYIVSVLGALR